MPLLLHSVPPNDCVAPLFIPVSAVSDSGGMEFDMTEIHNSIEKHLSDLFRARFPMIYLPTWEEERALKTLCHIGKDASLIKTARTMFIWRVTTGITLIENESNISTGGKIGLFVKSYGKIFSKKFMQFWIGELVGLCCLAEI